MLSASNCRLPAGLLLVLFAAVPSGFSSQHAAPAATTEDASLIGTLDQLWRFLDRVERTVELSVTREVGARLERLQARLTGHVDETTRRLDGQTEEDGRLRAQVGDIDTRLDAVSRRLDRLEAGSGAPPVFPRDCSDLAAGERSGVHLLQPGLDRSQLPVAAFCDLETDGGRWTVLQRRDDIQPRQDFYLGWQAYKRGFGELDGEFWWGLDNVWAMTSSRDRRYELRIDLWDFDGQTRHATYQSFRIASEAEGYTLTAVNYTGDAGDGLKYQNGMQFTTKDMDKDRHDIINCAQNHKGAWWYKDCHQSNLNGRYLSGTYSSNADGVCWRHWRGNNYSMKTTTMKIRPTRKL